MRTSSLISGAVVFAIGAAVYQTGCFFVADFQDCTLYPGAGCSGGTGAGTTTTTSTTGTGANDGGSNCDPTLGAIDVFCGGVFVSSSKGDDGNSGLQAAPLKSLAAALKKAGAGRVYACGEIFTEAVKLDAGTTLHGALDCANGWAYDPQKKTVVTAAAGAIPLTLTSTVVSAQVLDLKVVAADATAAGGSSIAVLADHATATFTRCDLVAGNAIDGSAGMSGGAQAMQAAGGQKGDDAGLAGTSNGGPGGTNVICNLPGGAGGGGGLIPSGNGVDGLAGDNGSGGAKGTGQTTTAQCTPGTDGNLGMPGPAGPVMPGLGTLDTSGYHGINGQPGQDGTNGTSGGGGGGSKATVTAHGAGGGGGGAGGCAGKKGTGGTAAGSSIVLVSLSASVSLVSCTLGASKAGNGGAGGDGQFGQLGGSPGAVGNGGMGAGSGCAGGKGGDAGNGGNGSGGLGGHSFGIALTGTAPVLDPATKAAVTFGAKGTGGKGGNMDADMNHGADGMAAACWDFAANAACK